MSDKNNTDRPMFASRLGAIAATVGSAVGLGNIWRFPYEAGAHGGSLFLLFYLVFVFAIGVPLMCCEFIVGRASRQSVFGAFRKLLPRGKWHFMGYLSVTGAILVLGFYSVVAGWTTEYFFRSVTGGFSHLTQEQFHEHFVSFTTGNVRPLLWTVAFLLLNHFILVRGVTKGIERMSNIMMPLLFAILIVFCIYGMTMPGFNDGMKFLFKPDLANFDSSTILGALGQTFFSLSLGIGCMITYGSYLPEKSSLSGTAITTALLGCLVALLAGMMIFPAVFTFGISPQAGPPLIFEALPSIFYGLPGGAVWSSLFFFLLIIASVSSTISMSEIFILYLTDQKEMGRIKATTIATVVGMAAAVLCCLSFGCLSGITIFGLNFFDLFNYVAANLLMPVGGLIVSIYVGWFLPRKITEYELTNGKMRGRAMIDIFIFISRWLAPVAIVCVFLGAIGVI